MLSLVCAFAGMRLQQKKSFIAECKTQLSGCPIEGVI